MTKTELQAKFDAAYAAMNEAMEALEAMPVDSLDAEDDLGLLAMAADLEVTRSGMVEGYIVDMAFERVIELPQVKQAV